MGKRARAAALVLLLGCGEGELPPPGASDAASYVAPDPCDPDITNEEAVEALGLDCGMCLVAVCPDGRRVGGCRLCDDGG